MNKLLVIFLFVLNCNIPIYADAPKPWQVTFQDAVTPTMSAIYELHGFIMIILTVIVLVVLGLLLYICLKFNAKSHPIPMKFSHNNILEIVWTVIPALVLILIAIPSFKILYNIERIPETEMTVKVVGHQWYWSYQYPEHGNIEFDSNIIRDDQLKSGDLRLFEVDNRLVIPENTVVRFLITAADVIHSFAVPAFGTKTDAVPGRINETWVKVQKRGVYYGQCSELCGVNHGFMPIAIEVVSKKDFLDWVEQAKQKFACNN